MRRARDRAPAAGLPQEILRASSNDAQYRFDLKLHFDGTRDFA